MPHSLPPPAPELAPPRPAVRARRPRTVAILVAAVVVLVGLGAAAGYVRHHYRAGVADLAAERPADARDHFDRALAVWPWSGETHRLAARAARLAGDLPAAEAHLNRAIKLAGEADADVQLEFLLLRAQTGDLEGTSQALFTLAEAGHPESPLILETLARAYLLGQRYKLAYACASRWLELHPDSAKAYLLRGFALERLDNHRGAAQDYHRALAADPDHLIARIRVAEMLLEDKQAPEAEPHLERLIRQAPDNHLVQARLGICRFLQGRPDEARRLMEQALPHLPQDATLLVTLAQLDIQDGRGADAEARLRTVLAADRADTEARFHLAAALRLQGKADAAAAELAEFDRYRALADRSYKLLQDVPDKPTATAAEYSELGSVLLAQGKDRQGLGWLDKALEKDPNHAPTFRALAAYYEGKGDAKRAAGYRARAGSP